jgi:hypothetical protein
MVREELPVEQPSGRLLGDGLGAVLAELGGVPVSGVRIRPGAALAVEPVDLVQLEQRLSGADGTHLLNRPLHRHRHRGRSRSGVGGPFDL